MPVCWTLAQVEEATRNTVDVMVSLGYLVAAAVLVALAFWVIRKWVNRSGDDRGVISGFTLAELRQLHRDGELTDEQFASAKAALIAHGLAAMGGLDRDDDEVDPDESNAAGLSDATAEGLGNESSDKSGEDTDGDEPPPTRPG